MLSCFKNLTARITEDREVSCELFGSSMPQEKELVKLIIFPGYFYRSQKIARYEKSLTQEANRFDSDSSG